MKFIIIPIEDAAEVFTKEELDAARKSLDGKEIIVHEEILLQKRLDLGLMTLPTNNESIEWTYPVYYYDSKELDNLLSSNKWSKSNEMVINQ